LCYRAALDALSHPAGEVLYVGHDAQHLAAAARAGMHTAAVNYTPGAQAEHLLARWEELLSVVDRLSAATPFANLSAPSSVPQATVASAAGR
jgi:FMN phosphatase YigB (HAD superfamily)